MFQLPSFHIKKFTPVFQALCLLLFTCIKNSWNDLKHFYLSNGIRYEAIEMHIDFIFPCISWWSCADLELPANESIVTRVKKKTYLFIKIFIAYFPNESQGSIK